MNLNNPESRETTITQSPLPRPAFRAVSFTDYRGQSLPSIFGPETKHFMEAEHARKFLLTETKRGGTIEQWDERSRTYRPFEKVEARQK